MAGARQPNLRTNGRGREGHGAGGRRPGRAGRPKQIEPVVITSPFPENARVAIIGGGLSGLICGRECLRHNLTPTIFDTGEHGYGGRLATRATTDQSLRNAPAGADLVFDHAAQFFTASDPWFQQLTAEWVAAGAVHTWDGPVGTLRGGAFEESDAVRYVGTGGMRGVAAHLADELTQLGVEMRRPCWISDMIYADGQWRLLGRGQVQGEFDVVVIAHNGKCANKLLSPAGVPRVARQMQALQLSAIWVLMAAFDEPVPVPSGMEGAFVADGGVVSWCGNNSKKLRLGGPECWTLISTPEYGKRNKAPQENVPIAKREQVTRDLLNAFRKELNLEELPAVVHTQAQLWGAALPVNTPNSPCVFDQQCRVGICGDWLSGASMQAAALSGKAMAERIALARTTPAASCGLLEELQPLTATAIGEFPAADRTADLQTTLA